MRNIDNYTKMYMKSDVGGQQIALPYRRKMVIEQVGKYQPTRILEIGCGLEPDCICIMVWWCFDFRA